MKRNVKYNSSVTGDAKVRSFPVVCQLGIAQLRSRAYYEATSRPGRRFYTTLRIE